MRPGSSTSLAALTAWSPGLRQAGRRTLRAAIEGREADVMVEAKGEGHTLAPMGVEIG
jgi:hypothetical protein